MYTKRKKGDAGYLRTQKRKVLCKTILEFGIVVSLLILGITQTGDRLNVLTIIAVLGCLPASKTLVELIMLLPHNSISEEKANEIAEHAQHMTTVFDTVFTSEKNIMPVESFVIVNHTVCGYSSSTKIHVSNTEQHIKQYLSSNHYSNVSVKLYQDYTAFLARVSEMAKMDADDSTGIKNVLLNISL